MNFADKVISVTEKLNSNRRHFRLIEQLESCSTSISLNIAEGKGRNSRKEFIQFIYIAIGSLYETITLLNIFHKREWINNEELQTLEEEGIEIASMIKGLINSISR